MNGMRGGTLKTKEALGKLVKGRNKPQKIVIRAKIALKVLEGMPKKRIVEGLNISRTTVYLWADRWEQGGVAALLKDAPRPGRIPLITPEKEKEVVDATVHTLPRHATHWSIRMMEAVQAISRMAVQRIWKKYHIHRQDEFLKFLRQIDTETPSGIDLHLIVDNYGSHKTKRVKEWLTKHPHFHMHFTPTSASWLNMVERFFSEITTKKIRRSVQTLIDAIMDFVEKHNENLKVFTWTKDAYTILAKVAKCTEALGRGH